MRLATKPRRSAPRQHEQEQADEQPPVWPRPSSSRAGSPSGTTAPSSCAGEDGEGRGRADAEHARGAEQAVDHARHEGRCRGRPRPAGPRRSRRPSPWAAPTAAAVRPRDEVEPQAASTGILGDVAVAEHGSRGLSGGDRRSLQGPERCRLKRSTRGSDRRRAPATRSPDRNRYIPKRDPDARSRGCPLVALRGAPAG